MKNYIYVTTTQLEENGAEIFNPVVTTDNGKLRVVHGYEVFDLQKFVRGNELLPQDGWYIETTKSVVDAINEHLNAAMAISPYVVGKNENGKTRFVINEILDDYSDDEDVEDECEAEEMCSSCNNHDRNSELEKAINELRNITIALIRERY